MSATIDTRERAYETMREADVEQLRAEVKWLRNQVDNCQTENTRVCTENQEMRKENQRLNADIDKLNTKLTDTCWLKPCATVIEWRDKFKALRKTIGRSSYNPMGLLHEWHDKFDVPIRATPGYPGNDRAELRYTLIAEELQELTHASINRDIVGVADALGDLLYVVYGAAHEWGIPVYDVLEEIHRSNMTKVWPDGTVHRREDGKILKPPTYSPADIEGILRKVGME